MQQYTWPENETDKAWGPQHMGTPIQAASHFPTTPIYPKSWLARDGIVSVSRAVSQGVFPCLFRTALEKFAHD